MKPCISSSLLLFTQALSQDNPAIWLFDECQDKLLLPRSTWHELTIDKALMQLSKELSAVPLFSHKHSITTVSETLQAYQAACALAKQEGRFFCRRGTGDRYMKEFTEFLANHHLAPKDGVWQALYFASTAAHHLEDYLEEV